MGLGSREDTWSLYQKSKQAVDQGRDAVLAPIQICSVCGYTVEGDAPEDKRQKFIELTTTRYPYRKFRDRFGFISYDELARFYEVTLPHYELKTRLLGE